MSFIRSVRAAALFLAAAGLLALNAPFTSCLGQGNLNPPGLPNPTMKSLDQIEARTIVNSNNTPGDAFSIFKITNSGAYYLTANIAGASGMHGITIAAQNVALDLNGFSIIGVPGSLNGISATNGGAAGLLVRNGTICNWGLSGIDTLVQPGNNPGAPGAVFEHLRLLTNDTSFTGGGVAGLRTSSAVVSRCTAIGNDGYGINALSSSIVNCTANYGDQGFGATSGSTLENCTADFDSNGVDLGDSSAVNCTLFANTSFGFFVRNNSRVAGNLVDGNGIGGTIGVYVEGNTGRDTVDGNIVVNNGGAGITLTNTGVSGNLVIRNTARGNGTNYLMGTGNSYGPIVNISGVGDISSNTNSSHPWANFSY